MQRQTERMSDELRTVLFAFLDACEHEPMPKLEEWIKEYPQYSRELTSFAVYQHVIERTDPTAEENEAFAGTDLRVGRKALEEAFATLPEPGPLASIVARAKELKLSPKTLATFLDLAADIIMKLERRMLILDSIPDVLLERLATSLYCGITQLRAFLGEATTQSVPTFYHAQQPPAIGRRQTFVDAVRGSRMMSPGQKEKWLKVATEGGKIED